MGLLNSISNRFRGLFYERDLAGNHWYSKNANWANNDLLQITKVNPVVNACFIYLSRLYASAEFFVLDEDGNEVDHWILEALKNPNPYQTKENFLEENFWFKRAWGYVYLFDYSITGGEKLDVSPAWYNLKSSFIEFKENETSGFLYSDDIIKTEFNYTEKGKEKTISMRDVIPYFDMPNGVCGENMLTSTSRLDAMRKPICSIDLAYNAKNIAITSNGKELYSSAETSQNGKPLTEQEKGKIESKLNETRGLGNGRSRAIVSGSQIKYQSLHIALSDLGLDDSIIKDAEKVVLGNGIPSDALKYDPKKSTFENQRMAEVKVLQNTIQTEMDDFTNGMTNKYLKEEGYSLVGKYDHLPIMQEENNKKFNVISQKAKSASDLMSVGVERDSAITEVELSNLELVNENQTQNEEG